MISQTQTASNQYGFYAVPKKLQPKKKYRDQEYQDMMNDNDDQQQSNQFHPIHLPTHPQHQIQPDYYINQAPYPQFKPRQSGLDYGVQVASQQLMDFDLQVTPLLEILVGRCVVSAINQLQQEKQKIEKKQQTQKYRKQRNAQLMVTQRLQAKSKRKHQQTQRRQLQQSIYQKKNRHVHQKIIVRKLAKNKLLNLGQDVITQLQQDGLLRYQPTLQLRIDYESWLYNEVTKMINEQQQVTTCVKKIIKQVQQDGEQKHKKKIQKEKERRRQIINERQRIKKINQQKRQKKRIHKFRINLHNLRQPLRIRFEQLLQTSNDAQTGVLKYETLDDGFIDASQPQQQPQALHISGGLFQYLLVLLNSTPQVHHTPDQLQQLLIKIINQLKHPLQIPLQKGQLETIKQLISQMQKNPNSFMIDKVNHVALLAKKLTFNLTIIQLTGIEIKPLLLESILLALLNIYFTTTQIPQSSNKQEKQLPPKQQQQQKEQQQNQQQQQQPTAIYSPTQQDKLRQTIRQKLIFKQIDQQQKLSKLQTVLRVRFQRQIKQNSDLSESKSNKDDNKNIEKNQNNTKILTHENEKKQNQQQEWIDIFDGQGWQRHTNKNPTELSRQSQKPSTYQLTGFENSFIYDQRVMHYLRKQIQRVLEIESGIEMDKYGQGLANLAAKLGKDIPVIDGQLATSE